jgi:hypothetical protein
MLNGLPLTDSEQMLLTLKWGGLEAWGSEMMYPHYSSAWAWASNTPFRWGKQIAGDMASDTSSNRREMGREARLRLWAELASMTAHPTGGGSLGVWRPHR